MDAAAPRRLCAIFTAPSGVRVMFKTTDGTLDGALVKLQKYSDHQLGHPGTAVAKLEDRLIPLHLAQYPDDPNRDLMQQAGGLQYLLFKPQDYLQRLWKESAEAELATIPPEAQVVFISLHAVLYHTESREFFSWVDPDVIVRWARRTNRDIASVITLIDDIYDVLKWLTQEDGLWHPLKSPTDPNEEEDSFRLGLTDSVKAVDDLLVALTWRSLEIFHAGKVADTLRHEWKTLEHSILATKHHLQVAHDLALRLRPPFYISHPITEPRRLFRQGDTNEYAALEDEIRLLTRAGVYGSRLLPLSPTTIDELRFELEDATDRDSVCPALLPRWNFPESSDVLHMPPPDPPEVDNVLDPRGILNEDVADDFRVLLRPLLLSLSEQIRMQIDARDRRLVQRAYGLLVWRPYFNGKTAQGVLDEISHRNNLVDYDVIEPKRTPCFVYSPPEDLGLYRVRYLFETLVGSKTKEPLVISRTGSSLSQAEATRLMEVLASREVTIGFAGGTMTEHRLRELLAQAIDFRFRDVTGAGALARERGPGSRAAVSAGWAATVDDARQKDELSSYLRPECGDRVYSQRTSPEQFIQWVESQFT